MFIKQHFTEVITNLLFIIKYYGANFTYTMALFNQMLLINCPLLLPFNIRWCI
jgi:hypothetical protein